MLLALLLACSTGTELVFSPAALDLGEVDFAGEMPEGGYASESVTLSNEGGPTVVISLPAYDFDHLCLAGFPEDQEYPVELGELEEGASYVFEVGICAYVPGELTTDVEIELEVDTDGTPDEIALPITFTAVRTGE